MQKSIAVTELRKRAHAVVEEVAESHVPYVLTRSQRPRAALVPYEDFLRLKELSREKIDQRFDQVRAEIQEHTAGFSEEEVAADVAAALAELRG